MRKLYPPPPTSYSPQIKDVKMARFGFCAASPLIWGAWGFAVPFYSDQDCRLDRVYQVKLEAEAFANESAWTHVLIRKTPCSNRKWSCSIYMTTDPGDWPHPSGSNIGNTCTVNCIWRTPSLKGHKTNTHSWSLQSYRLLWLSLKADTSLRRRERYSS